MPLIEEKRRPSPLLVRPIVTAVASVVAAAVFLIVVVVVARATADGVVMPPRDAGFVVDAGVVDAGVLDAGVVDAGPEFVDAGALVTVSLDAGVDVSDGGPASVDGPPFDAGAVVSAAAVVVERCAGDALRWDPSLGGPFSLVVDLPVGAAPAIVVDGLVSPVLTACLERRAVDVAWPEALRASTLAVPLAVRARAILDGSGRVNWSDAAVTAAVENVKAVEPAE